MPPVNHRSSGYFSPLWMTWIDSNIPGYFPRKVEEPAYNVMNLDRGAFHYSPMFYKNKSNQHMCTHLNMKMTLLIMILIITYDWLKIHGLLDHFRHHVLRKKTYNSQRRCTFVLFERHKTSYTYLTYDDENSSMSTQPHS